MSEKKTNNLKMDIEWVDDSLENESSKQEKTSSQDFASLFENSNQVISSNIYPNVGDKLKATILQITSSNDILLDFGAKEPAVMAKDDLLNENGEFSYKQGDEIEAFVISNKNNEILLSTSLTQKMANNNAAQQAYENKLPVKGKIVSLQKGGFLVSTLGRDAFCPISQIALHFVENPEDFVGKSFEFLIQELSNKNCVVSRAKLLQEKSMIKINDLAKKINEETIVEGIVVQLKDFGAVVEFDHIQGFVHISEIGYGHYEKASDILSIGDKIKVQVLDIIPSKVPNKMPRISLSMKAVQIDPWDDIQKKYKPGDSYNGKVVRFMPFGAFVELEPGIDGLIHVSEMSWIKKVHHPSDLLKINDMVNIRILEIDSLKKKISLSLKAIENDPWAQISHEFLVGHSYEGLVERLKPFGAIVCLKEGVTGLIPSSNLKKAYGQAYRKKISENHKIIVSVIELDKESRKIRLAIPDIDEDQSSKKDFEEYMAQKNQESTNLKNPNNNNFNEDEPSKNKVGSFGDLLAKSLKQKEK